MTIKKINPIGKTIRIGPLDWDVKEMEEEHCPDYLGLCTVPMDKTMYLHPELKGMEALEVLLHESIHAIDGMRDLKLKEEMVAKLGYSFALLLSQNPWLLDYAKEKIKEEYGS
jgi:hypothetical protein